MKKANRIRVYKIAALLMGIFIAWQISVYSQTPAVTERAVVTMMGIDRAENGGRKVSIRVLVPVSGETKFTEISAETEKDSLQEALTAFSVLKGRKIEFQSCVLLVFGSELTQDGIGEDAKYLYTTGTLNPGVLTVAAKGTAQDFILAAADFGSDTSRDIAKFLTRFQENTQSPGSVLASFLDADLSESGASYMPVISLKSADGSEKEGGNESGGESEKNGGEKAESGGGKDSGAVIESADTALIFKSGKAVGELTRGETRGLIWSLSSSKKGEIDAGPFEFNGQTYESVSGFIRKKTVRVKTYFSDGKPVIRYTIAAKVEIKPNPQIAAQTDQTALSAAIGDAFQKTIQAELESAFSVSKEKDADFFLARARFYRTCSKQIKSYLASGSADFLNDLVFEADVAVKVLH